MGDEFHLTAARALEMMERSPKAVWAHVESCEGCQYLLALVRRFSGVPSPEQSEVVVDLLRSWSGTPPRAPGDPVPDSQGER